MKRIHHLTALAVALSVLVSCGTKRRFTFAVLPDTQHYARFHPDIFHAQTDWIRQHADTIAFVLHAGDITSQNNDEQWHVAQQAMNKLDGHIPYVLSIGNHDLGTEGRSDIRDSESFNTYFPYGKYAQARGFGGAFEPGKMDNTWHTFRAGSKDWLVISLEFGPRNAVLSWADRVISEHPKHLVILLTHAYMYHDDTRMDADRNHSWLASNYGRSKGQEGDRAVNDGEAIWEKLVKRHPNMRFVFSGHVLGDGTGTLVSEGIHGNKVYQMLANYQTGVDGSENGGNGFLRLLTVDTKRKRVTVRTYSPHTDTFKTELDQQFSFEQVEF